MIYVEEAGSWKKWMGKITLLKNNNKSQRNISSVKPDGCILIWRHWWRNCPRITNTLKRPSNFNFSAFRAVIYQNLLCRRLCIVVRSWKLLSVNIVKYRCISLLRKYFMAYIPDVVKAYFQHKIYKFCFVFMFNILLTKKVDFVTTDKKRNDCNMTFWMLIGPMYTCRVRVNCCDNCLSFRL